MTPLLRIRGRDEKPGSEHAALSQEPDKLPQVRVHAIEGVRAGCAVVDVREVDAIPPSPSCVPRLAIVNLGEGHRVDIVDRLSETRCGSRVEDLFNRRQASILAGPEAGIQVLDAAADESLGHGAHTHSSAEKVGVDGITGSV
jgi:hypothetical protein